MVVAGLAATGILPLARPAVAQALPERHGLSAFGDLKYPADFKNFDYVNPAAPKGGRLSTVASQWAWNQNPTTFSSFNTLVLKGEAPPGMEVTFTSLMTRATDEPDAVYGLLARSVEVLADGDTYVFRLRPEARFHDGSPITAEDVAFSLNIIKEKGYPDVAQTIRAMASATAEGPDRVVVKFDAKRSRSLPMIVATLPIVSKAYYATRDFEQSTLEPPLGSGPYKIGRYEAGRYVEYERVKDWWGADLPVMRGQYNFDVVRMEFYRERTASFEAFKSGAYTVREEFVSAVWAQQYEFPALAEKKVVRFELEDLSPSGQQGWYFNTRRPKFQDRRVREAIGLVFDFEWSNKNLFFGSYERISSFFPKTDFEAKGLPSPAELKLLEPLRGKVPDEVFGEPFLAPVSDGSGRDRALLRRASALLTEAGWAMKDGALRNPAGEAFTIEFIDTDTSFQRIINPFAENLKRLGIEVTQRVLDGAQYQRRKDEFDFDVLSRRVSFGATPDESLRQNYAASAADQRGSSNLAGIKDPAIDALIEAALAAKSREELYVACRALDRVLRAGRYWIPHWQKSSHWIAMWDVYARPAVKPRYSRGIQETWWVDMEKAQRLGKGL
jgi:microcin C transport system substrate-binding protein